MTPATSATAPPSAAAYNATDVAFTSGMIRLEGQARALSGLVTAHTGSTQLRGYATQFGDDTTDSQYMSGLMQQWHQILPSPYQPGAGMIPGTGPGRPPARTPWLARTSAQAAIWARMRHDL